MAKPERRRVSKDHVRANAAAGGGGRGSFFRLPEGVREWWPDKADKYSLDFLPWEVKGANHPDKVEPGQLWYKMPFFVHRNIGVRQETVVCPSTFGKPCVICEQRAKLLKERNADATAVKALNYQKWVAYCIADPDDADKVAVYCQSYGKFAKVLEKELKEGGEDVLGFYDVNKDGRTLKLRFSQEEFNTDDGKGGKFLQCSRIDFVERGPMDEDEVLEKTPALETLLEVMSYDRLKALFLQTEEEPVAGEGESEPVAPARTKKPAATTKPKEEPAEEPQESEEPGDSETEFQEGDHVSFTHKGKQLFGKITDIDGDDVEVEGENGEDYSLELEDLSAAPAEEKETEAGGDDPDGPIWAVGDEVTWDDGDECGEIVKLDAEGKRAKCKNAAGEKEWVTYDDLKPTEDVEEDEKPSTTPAAATKPKDTAKPAATASPAKNGKTSSLVCPHKGGTFGKNTDKYEECDACPHWKECAKANHK